MEILSVWMDGTEMLTVAAVVKLSKLDLPDAVNPAPGSENGKPHRGTQDT